MTVKAEKFLDKTQEYALQGVNPGGIYPGAEMQRISSKTGFYTAIFLE